MLQRGCHSKVSGVTRRSQAVSLTTREVSMHKPTNLLFAALLFLAGACAQAQGTDHKWYVSLDVGQSKLDGNSAGYSNVDDSSSAYAVRFGYRFVPWFALEGGYTDIGNFSSHHRADLPRRRTLRAHIYGTHFNSRLPGECHGHLAGGAAFPAECLAGLLLSRIDAELGEQRPGGNLRWTSKDTVARYALGAAVPVNDALRGRAGRRAIPQRRAGAGHGVQRRPSSTTANPRSPRSACAGASSYRAA